MLAIAKWILSLVLCATLSSGCLTYRYAIDEPTKTGTALAAVTEVAVGTLFVAVCDDSSMDGDATCPSGAAEVLASGIALGVALDLLGLFGAWLIRDLD